MTVSSPTRNPLKWLAPRFSGEPPGPCNMHTADLVGKNLYVFRGGDGRAYLNDLHGLDMETWWHTSFSEVGGSDRLDG